MLRHTGWVRRGALLLLVAFLLSAFPGAVWAQGGAAEEERPPAGPQVQVLSSGPEALVVEWRLPPFSIEEVALEGTTYSRIVAPDMGLTGEAGQPQLPAGESWLALPPGATADVLVLEAEKEEIRLSRPVLPVPQVLPPEPRPDAENPAWPEEPTYRYRPDAAVYGSSAAYPGFLARLEGEGWIRSQRVALLRVYPFQYEPAPGLLHVYRRLRVEVRFGSAPQGGSAVPEPAPFEALFQELLLNADTARFWRSAAAPMAVSASPTFPPQPAVKVQVDHDGFYRLSFERLRQAGVPVDEVDLHTLRLFLDGQEVALWVPDENPHPGTPVGALFFYGQGARSKYTDENTYWLTWGQGAGRRMAERPGGPIQSPSLGDFTATVHQESNTQYTSLLPVGGDDVERWFWTYLYTGGVREATLSLDTPAPAEVSHTATLRLSLYGGFAAWPNPDHHVQVYLNDAFLGDGWWDAQTPLILELPFPQRLFYAGENRVRLYAPGDTGYSYDYFYLDWIELTYRRTFAVENDRLEFSLSGTGEANIALEPFTGEDIIVLDTSDPLNPVRIVEGTVEPAAGGYRYTFAHQDTGMPSRYLATTLGRAEEPPAVFPDHPSSLYAPENGADVLLIAPAEFLPAIEPLAADDAGRGMRTRVVDVQDIYDEFSGGRRDPRAIRSFLAYAYAHWTPPAPAYVLLVGDGHYDFKDYRGSGLPNPIPPYLAYVDPWIGETAADNRYVSLVGDDPLADMLLGRLPVNTPEEAAAVVDKILAYRQVREPADWQGQVLFVADNADGAGNFPALSDEIANLYLPAYYTADKVYLGVNYPYENPAVTARAAILQALNDGRLLLNYVGHGAVYFLATERMLRAEDADGLSNGNALPVLLSWSCYSGMYILPYASSPALGEVWVRAPNRGAIAAWVPTGLGMAWAHHYMNQGVFESLFLGRLSTLGQAALAGNLRLYAAAPSMGYQLDTYVLLGDPTLEIPVLPADLYLQVGPAVPNPVPGGGAITLTLSLGNAGPATAYDVVLRAELPAGWSLRDWTSADNLPLTLVSADPPLWKVSEIPPSSGGTLLLHLQAGMTEGNWSLSFTAGTGSREVVLENNQFSLEVGVILAGRPERLLVQVEPPEVPSGGQALLTVTVLDAFGRPVADGTPVTLAASGGRILPAATVTLQGRAQARFLAEGVSGEVWLTVSSGTARSLVYIRILPTASKRATPGPASRP
ncbi:MAG: C25 family cysteine peptidase [Chloroflexia bacterium]